LREAQPALIRQMGAAKDKKLRQAPPLFWAGFVCHGRSQ